MKPDQDYTRILQGYPGSPWLKGFVLMLLFEFLLFVSPGPGQERRQEQERGPEEFTNTLEMVFRLIPAGAYTVGPPKMEPREAINATGNPAAGEPAKIDRPFFMCIHEVRAQDYRAFCQATGHAEPCGENYDCKKLTWVKDYRPLAAAKTPTSLAMPITCVSFDDAVAFCQWLSKKEGRTYRLPTEIEWEYAARAGSDLPFLTSAKFDISAINGRRYQKAVLIASPRQVIIDMEVISNDADQAQNEVTHLFRALPNAWGLYHMLGNAQEFVVMTRKPPDDKIPLSCFTILSARTNQMLRGGSWLHDERDCSVFIANYNCPPYSNSTIGFRIVLEMGQK